MKPIVPFYAPIAVLAVIACAAPLAAAHRLHREPGGVVVAVPSAETLVVREPNGKRERVRLIGLHAQPSGACFAKQAVEETRRLALGKRVQLIQDRSQGLRTPDGAILAYSRLPHGVGVGYRLVRGGYALVSYRKPFAQLRSYRSAQIRARAGGKGLWSSVCADLSIALQTPLSAVTIGNTLSYGLFVRNARKQAARNVRVTLTFSAPIRVVGPVPGCTSTSTQVVCRIGDLEGADFLRTEARPDSTASEQIPPPARGTRSFYFTVAALEPGALAVQARLASAKPDAAPKDNSARTLTTVNPGPALADLAVTMRSEPDHPQVGGRLAYTITVINHGPSEAIGVALAADPVGVGANFRSISCRQICLRDMVGFYSGPGVLAPGEQATVELGVVPSSTDAVTNTATVNSATPDPNAANDTASTTTAPVPRVGSARLGITVTPSLLRVRVGQHFLYTVTVRNEGPDAATEVVLRGGPSQPGEAEFLGAPPEARCDAKAVCHLGTLAVDAQETIPLEFVARHVRFGTLDEYASASTSTLSPNPNFYVNRAVTEARTITISPAGSPSFVIGTPRVGRLHLAPRTSPVQVTDALGVSRDKGFGEFCDRHWRHGLTISFVGFAGVDPCGFKGTVSVVRAIATGAEWRTPRGLRIGDPVARIPTLYPGAARHGRWFWLTVRRTSYGDVAYGLEALVRNGRVRVLAVSQGN